MAIQKTRATYVAVKEETTFKGALTFADGDVIAYDSFTMKPDVESITRDYVNSRTLLKGQPLQGKSTASGSATIEVVPDAADSKKLAGHVLYDTTFGKFTSNGATIDAATIGDHIAATDGDAGVYYLSDASDTMKSLGVKYAIGGTEANSVDIRGVLVSSLKINFPTQGIVTSDFSLEGSTGFIPVAQGATLAEACSSKTPYVARGMTVIVGGASVCASDLSIDITNTVTDFTCVTDTGTGAKTVTERAIKGSFKIAFENLDEVNAYNAATSMSIFAKATSLDGNEFAVYIPVASRTSLDIGDDSGTVVQTVEFEVASSCGAGATQPIMIASK